LAAEAQPCHVRAITDCTYLRERPCCATGRAEPEHVLAAGMHTLVVVGRIITPTSTWAGASPSGRLSVPQCRPELSDGRFQLPPCALRARDARICRSAFVSEGPAVGGVHPRRHGEARPMRSGCWTRSARLPVGSEIHPSVRAASSCSAAGVVVSPSAAARALSAAMTASRAWSDLRQPRS